MKTEGKGQTMPEFWRRLNILRGALPHCGFEMAHHWIGERRPQAALNWAYIEAARSVVGLIRGQLRSRITHNRNPYPGDTTWRLSTDLEIRQLRIMFLEAEEIKQQINDDPKAVFETAFDYFDMLNRLDIIVPARALILLVDEALDEVADLSYSDLTQDLNGLRSKLIRIVHDPKTESLRELETIDNKLIEIVERALRIRNSQTSVATAGLEEARRRKRRRSEDKGRRRRQRDWRRPIEDQEGAAIG